MSNSAFKVKDNCATPLTDPMGAHVSPAMASVMAQCGSPAVFAQVMHRELTRINASGIAPVSVSHGG